MTVLRAATGWAWHFVVGDDWRLAAGAVAAIGGTAVLVAVGVNAWWLAPAAVPIIIAASLRRAAGDR